MTTQSDKEKLLSILHTHGQQFLKAFDVPAVQRHQVGDSDVSKSESEEEWAGFSSSSNNGIAPSEVISDDAYDGSEQENGSDHFTGGTLPTPDIMVFLESTQRQQVINLSTKELRKSFMSSKVSNITSSAGQPTSRKRIPDGDSDDERGSESMARTNIQNDALLHRLVHTKLLSGSLNPELDLSHAQKGRALAGRVLELTGEAKLGKGESMFRQEQRSKAAKRVRQGLTRKKREREQKALEEAKNLGNYHPTLKRLYESDTSSTRKKKRVKGLGMGVGKFVRGTLKLSRQEISAVSWKRPRNNDQGTRSQRPRCK